MSLKDRITEDMKTAMRGKEADRLLAIRMLLAAIKQREVDERIVLEDAQVLAIVDKLIKQRKDSVTAFELAARQDLVAKEQAEIAVLAVYLPAQMSAQEVQAAITAAIATSGAQTGADMGKVMAILKPALAGKTDLSKVSGLVKDSLQAKLQG
jgi:uncharacterized protein